MTSKKTASGYFKVSKNGSLLTFSRSIGEMKVTVNMPKNHSPEQEKLLLRQIVELIEEKTNKETGGVKND